MPVDRHSRDERFYDVFISYSHAMAGRVEAVAAEIKRSGRTVFLDQHFSDLRDISRLDSSRIEHLRDILSVSTSLMYFHSREAAAGQPQSVWTPWELGFFDGAVSDRIGIYLLDGAPESFDPGTYFRGSEYLQLYTPVIGGEKAGAAKDPRLWALEDFLATHAARARRIDNVRSAFQWLKNFQVEMAGNPANVMLGVWEWYLHHAAEAVGNGPAAETLRSTKNAVAQLRRTGVEAFRLPHMDAAFDVMRKMHPQNRDQLDHTMRQALDPWMWQMDKNPLVKQMYKIMVEEDGKHSVTR